MKKRITGRQILAIAAIVLLVGMYVSALVLSLIGSDFARTLLKIALLGTFIVPIIIYVIMMFYRLGHKNEAPEPDVYADSKDDPYEQEPEESQSGDGSAQTADSGDGDEA